MVVPIRDFTEVSLPEPESVLEILNLIYRSRSRRERDVFNLLLSAGLMK